MTEVAPFLPVAEIDAAVQALDVNDAHSGIGPAEGLALRIGKIAEECGEAHAALIGMRGQNPRKPRTSEQDLIDELLDVALAAFVAAASLTPSWAARFAPHVVARTSRVRRAVAEKAAAQAPDQLAPGVAGSDSESAAEGAGLPDAGPVQPDAGVVQPR